MAHKSHAVEIHLTENHCNAFCMKVAQNVLLFLCLDYAWTYATPHVRWKDLADFESFVVTSKQFHPDHLF